ncbi:hypothetical protein MC885_017604 [Smutsia gigantea]|nr:hypothetical protein MC885_017604 [Smutsia gigantea]
MRRAGRIASISSSRAGCCAPFAEELRSPQGRPPPAFAAPWRCIEYLGLVLPSKNLVTLRGSLLMLQDGTTSALR